MVTWCNASGKDDQKSQLLLGSRMFVLGSRFTAWFKSGNCNGSRQHITGVLLPITSQFPSSVYNFNSNARISRSWSAAPRSPVTVEKRANMSVFLPTTENIFAFVYFVMSLVTLNVV